MSSVIACGGSQSHEVIYRAIQYHGLFTPENTLRAQISLLDLLLADLLPQSLGISRYSVKLTHWMPTGPGILWVCRCHNP